MTSFTLDGLVENLRLQILETAVKLLLKRGKVRADDLMAAIDDATEVLKAK